MSFEVLDQLHLEMKYILEEEVIPVTKIKLHKFKDDLFHKI